MAKETQKTVVFEYFANRPNQEIQHAEVVDWATEEWFKRTGSKLRDPDRAIRTLYSDGVLEKIRTGVYKFDPKKVAGVDKRDFTASDKKAIFARDNFKCTMCGLGKREGATLHADHVIPRDKGGTGDLSNGQTLCSACNMLKKNHGSLEFGKRFFEKILDGAIEADDARMQGFCQEILSVYAKYGIKS
jgi:hypothetical protein